MEVGCIAVLTVDENQNFLKAEKKNEENRNDAYTLRIDGNVLLP